MKKLYIRRVIWSFLLLSFLGFVVVPMAYAQCGLPGMPKCASKKSSTAAKRRAAARRRAAAEARSTVTNPPIVYRQVTPIPYKPEIMTRVCYSPDIANTQVTCPNDVKITYLSGEQDHGYDIAVVQYDKALLREEPKYIFSRANKCFSPYNPLVETPCEGDFLSRGDQLVVLDRTSSGDWLDVINTETSKEGWVYRGHVTLYYTYSPKTSSDAIIQERTAGYGDPEITIVNQTDQTLTLKLGRSSFSVSGNSRRKITLTAGTYKFWGGVPRAYPTIGKRYFSNGGLYSWTFYISTTP